MNVTRRVKRSLSASIFFLSLALLENALITQANAQELYAYRSGRGVVTFTSKKPEGKSFWSVKPPPPRYSSFRGSRRGGAWGGRAQESKYDHLIQQLALQQQLEPALVKAVIHVESGFNHQARSHKGAQGLMQLMPGTAKRFGVSNSYEPVENIVGGVRYLRWLFQHFDGNIRYVLAGYNAGERAVERYGGIPPYSETQEYVRRVIKMRDQYRCDYSGQKSC